ncbi:MAG TPA: SUMF1/EgtB/PvdO family nonheme iron enzyme, partial [Lacipirellulaceae bacterium]
GNPPDTTGSPNPAGSVPYAYRIGKYEVSEQMINKANALGGLGITKDTRGPDKPATNVSWFEAARFVNWLNTSTGHTPAYKFVPLDQNSPPELVAAMGFTLWEPGDAGYNSANRFRNSQTAYFLPSVDEWYKAAFYDPVNGVYWNYATGSNAPSMPVPSGTAPGTAIVMQGLAAGPTDIMTAGGLGPYGTMAQGGNVDEWEETEFDLVNDNPLTLRGRRGGGWDSFPSTLSSANRFAWQPSNAVFGTGFRVGSIVPEPSTFFSVIVASITLAVSAPRRRNK